MSHLYRLGLFVVCLTGAVAPTEAGCCGSPTYGVGYTPYYAGYTPYYTGYSSYYTGYSSYYAPYASGYAPGIGCSSCNSCSSCGCAPCIGNCGVGCASGNCASGNCGVGCTANSVPTGGLQPVADPANGTARSIEKRLEVIERELRITPPRDTKTYAPDNFGTANPNRNRERVRDDNNPNFEAPAPGSRNRENEDNGMFQERSSTERSFKPVTEKIAIPGGDLGAPETVIQSKKPAPGPSIDDEKKDQSLRLLDTRVTSRAVAPRERRSSASVVATAKTKTTRTLQVDAQPSIIDVVRY